MKQSITLIVIVLLITISCDEDPVKPENHKPIIFSLTAFPDVIGLQDSVIIICNAMDPDADTLVYDWITDSRLKIKGAFGNNHWLYHTFENSHIFYPTQYVNVPIDTVWVQCFVRDVKGGSDAKLVLFIVKQDSTGS